MALRDIEGTEWIDKCQELSVMALRDIEGTEWIDKC